MIDVVIKKGREKPLLRRHPWIFSGSIASVSGEPSPGETVRVLDFAGNFLAWGAFSPTSQIRVRVWEWEENVLIDDAFFNDRLVSIVRSRKVMRDLFNDHMNSAFRLVNGESDGIPGLIVDVYGNIIVIQILSAGVEYWKDSIVRALVNATHFPNVIERSDVDVRKLEGLPLRSGILKGKLGNSEVLIHENNLQFWVDMLKGHKTGFYLDQKENRRIIQSISENKTVLDCFSFTGGFTCAAAAGGASKVCAVEASEESIVQAERNVNQNNLDKSRISFIRGDVFSQLRKFRDQDKSFDLIILDPPKFAQSSAQLERAARGYKDINLLAIKLLKPGGYLATFSCSGSVSEDLFQKIIAGAAEDAKVTPQILKRMHQNFDHPVSLNFPEAAYLKGLLLRI